MKRRRSSREMKGKHKSLDRISALPQDTIEKILTLMPLKDALRTSILSKKWRRNKNIKKFVFETLGNPCLWLPPSIFLFQRLEHLHLSHCEYDPPSLNMGFSILKSLHICSLDITNKMLQGFLTNCPLLEKFTWINSYDVDFDHTECDWVELLKCLPSVQILELSPLIIAHLDADDMPQKHAISLPNLRALVLDICFVELSFVLYMISGSPNLEKIKLKMCWDHDEGCRKNDLPDIQDYTGLKLDQLKEMEITSFNNHDLEMDFVKLIMANSPVLKKARIELNADVSVDEEVKMFRDLMSIPFLRASPITIERPKDD